MGWKIFGLGVTIGFAAMLLPNYAGQPLGVAAWSVAVFIGLPWVVVDKIRQRHLETQKKGRT